MSGVGCSGQKSCLNLSRNRCMCLAWMFSASRTWELDKNQFNHFSSTLLVPNLFLPLPNSDRLAKSRFWLCLRHDGSTSNQTWRSCFGLFLLKYERSGFSICYTLPLNLILFGNHWSLEDRQVMVDHLKAIRTSCWLAVKSDLKAIGLSRSSLGLSLEVLEF